MAPAKGSDALRPYYRNVNPDLLERLPLNAERILEIGCGAASLARAYRNYNPSVQYHGIELFDEAAQQARPFLHDLITGNIEEPVTMQALGKWGGDFDVLVFGDVLEHLHDPWRILSELRQHIRQNGVCAACIPNIAHWSVLQQQLSGRWDYADAGLLDRTHLRFFTLETSIELFQKAGWTVLDAKPRIVWPEKTAAALQKFLPLAESLGIPADKMQRNLSALQWVIRAVNGPLPKVFPVIGLGLKKIAGVTEARVDHPLAALNTLPAARTAWGAGGITLPKGQQPGIFMLHRHFLNEANFNGKLESMAADGWTIVTDMDDDPHRWPEFVDSNFRAFRAVHAVTVSTEPLADLIRQWNPYVKVFPNAIAELPEWRQAAGNTERLRIFFGALNRNDDWGAVRDGLMAAAQDLIEEVEWVIVHDKGFYDALPVWARKSFQQTLPPAEYMRLMASCDVNLLPLADNTFNRLKSDLKFIESCAAGAVPVCSPVVYDARTEHLEIGVFATTSSEWHAALLRSCKDRQELERRRTLGRQYVARHRMHAHQTQERLDFYRHLREQHKQLEAARKTRLAASQLQDLTS